MVDDGVGWVSVIKHIFRAPSVQIQQIERQRPMTRTLSHEPIFTPKRQPQPQRSLFSLYNPPPRTEAPTPAPPLTTRRQTIYGNFEPQLKSANRFGNLREGFRFGTNTPKPTQRVLSNHYNAIPTPQQYVYPTRATTTTAAPTALPRFNSLYSRLRELKSVGSLSSPNPKRFAGLNLDKELEKLRTENLKLAKPTFDDLSVSDLTQILEDTKVKKDPLVALLEGSEEITPKQVGRFGQFGQPGGRYASNNGRRWSNSQVRLIEESKKDLEGNFFTVQPNRENEPRGYLKSSPVGEGFGQFDHKEFFDIEIGNQERTKFEHQGSGDGSGDGLDIDMILLTETTITTTTTSTTTLTTAILTTTTKKITVPKTSTKITTPKVITRKITTPRATTRKFTTSKTTTRKGTTPKVTTPKATTSKFTTPKITTRKSTTRKLTTSKATTREVTSHASTPKPTTRKTTTRAATTRKATTPRVQNTTPRVTTRKYETTRSRQNPYRYNQAHNRLPNSLPDFRSRYLNSRSMFHHAGPSWAEQIKARSAQAQNSAKIIPQSVIDYHMKTKGKIPDILRRQLDRQQAMAVSLETINSSGK